MLQRDYLMKLIETLSTVIARVLLKKEVKNYEGAEEELVSAAKSLAGLDLNLIKILSAEDIISLMKTSDIFAGRCLISAELLKQYGDILSDKGKAQESLKLYMKSLWLYLEAILTKELPAPEDYYERVDFMIKNLALLEFPDQLKLKVFEYYEFSGRYSKAEDILFELIESDFKNIHNTGKQFYRDLSLKTDDELINGNFSREEIEDGLEEINNLLNSD